MKNVLIALCLLLSISAVQAQNDPYAQEALRYHSHLQDSVTSGQMTVVQAEYLYQMKINQLMTMSAQQQNINAANNAAMLNYSAALLGLGAPRPLGGTMNCTTTQQGIFTRTNCF